jgi:hypothetical protein
MFTNTVFHTIIKKFFSQIKIHKEQLYTKNQGGLIKGDEYKEENSEMKIRELKNKLNL